MKRKTKRYNEREMETDSKPNSPLYDLYFKEFQGYRVEEEEGEEAAAAQGLRRP